MPCRGMSSRWPRLAVGAGVRDSAAERRLALPQPMQLWFLPELAPEPAAAANQPDVQAAITPAADGGAGRPDSLVDRPGGHRRSAARCYRRIDRGCNP
jgi:hypothetical protein